MKFFWIHLYRAICINTSVSWREYLRARAYQIVFTVTMNSRELSFLRGDCMQVMFSVGKYTPEVIQKYFVSHYTDYDERSRTKALVDMLLCNGHNHQAIGKLIDDVRNANNDDTYSIRMDALVKELSRMCCFDFGFGVLIFMTHDPSFMTENGFICSCQSSETVGEM